MNEVDKMDVRQAHVYFAQNCFNLAWELIDKDDRKLEETDMMIHLAHASLYHWSRRADCTDQNLSIGYWQLSRVYSLAELWESALRSAKTCLSYSQKHGVARVFVGYAHEALARAYSGYDEVDKMKMHLEQAKDIAVSLAIDERDQLLEDLKGIS